MDTYEEGLDKKKKGVATTLINIIPLPCYKKVLKARKKKD